MEKFKLFIILGYFVLILAAIIGGMVIIVYRPESFQLASTFLGTTLTAATGAVVTFWMLGSQAKKLDQVAVQTNGANTALRQTIVEKDAKIEELQTQLLAVVAAAPPASVPLPGKRQSGGSPQAL